MPIRSAALPFAAVLLAAAVPAELPAASAYPDRPVRMIVPWAPGGGSDVSGRILAARLTETLGQQVVVDNRPGAAGNIGTAISAKATADGYNLLLADTAFATSVSLYTKLGYDPIRDFAPVSMAATTPIVAVVHTSVPATSLKELIALAKAQPGKLNAGSGGNGGSVHLALEMFQLLTGTKLTHVPYKGSGPAVVDLAGGIVQAMFSTAPPVVPLAKAGRIRALAVTGNARSPFLPDVPTMKEAGLPDFVASNWYGVLAPVGTPRVAIERLHAEIAKAVQATEARERLGGAGLEALGSATPQEFGRFVEAEVSRWAKVVKAANIKID